MNYLSICSGIEAATVAWKPLGWEALAFAEIDKFPSAVLAHHYPEVPNVGDFTQIRGDEFGPTDLLVGGTPCQSFSVAGQRGGLDDARGNLTLEFLRLAGRARPRWFVWENVPGVFSMDRGRAFGTILRQVAELGYGYAWRVFDAQYFNVPQRRSRVFIVGHLGDWLYPAAIFFEPHSVSGNPPPGRGAKAEVARTFTSRSRSGGWSDDIEMAAGGYMRVVPAVAKSLTSRELRLDAGTQTLVVANTLRGEGFDASEDGTGRQNLVAIFAQNQLGEVRISDVAGTLNQNSNASGRNTPMACGGFGVRRLTPRECERLQGFPDDYTLITYRGKPAADGPRYKAIGNSMAVPVMRWIGRRIGAMNEFIKRRG